MDYTQTHRQPTITIGKRTFTMLFPDLLRPLTDREYQDLKNSIRKSGVQVAIVVDEHDGIIDGGNRAMIAAELQIRNVPTDIRKHLTQQQKIELALTLNGDRRHLSKSERKQLIEDRKKRIAEARAKGASIRTIAQQEGIDPKQVQRDLNAVKQSGVDMSTPEVPDTVVGRDGKEYPAVRPGIAQEEDDAAEEPEDPVSDEDDTAPVEQAIVQGDDDGDVEPAAPTEKQTLDPDGNPLPPQAVAAIRMFSELKKLDQMMLAVKKEMDRLNKSPLGPLVNWSRAKTFLTRSRRTLEVDRPAYVCTGCQGSKCPACNGVGAVSAKIIEARREYAARQQARENILPIEIITFPEDGEGRE
jgi:hypothetical protein